MEYYLKYLVKDVEKFKELYESADENTLYDSFTFKQLFKLAGTDTQIKLLQRELRKALRMLENASYQRTDGSYFNKTTRTWVSSRCKVCGRKIYKDHSLKIGLCSKCMTKNNLMIDNKELGLENAL